MTRSAAGCGLTFAWRVGVFVVVTDEALFVVGVRQHDDTGLRMRWTGAELAKFLDDVRHDRYFALWRVAVVTGARRGELLAISWRNLDLDAGSVTIDRQLLPDLTFGPPKSKNGVRTITLDPVTIDALREHRSAQLVERELAGSAYADQDLAFADPLGAPINPRTLTATFIRHRDAAGIEAGGVLHTLRHSACTTALVAGEPVHLVAARLGDDAGVLYKTYSHVLPRSDERVASTIAAAVDNALTNQIAESAKSPVSRATLPAAA
jgi:integrase